MLRTLRSRRLRRWATIVVLACLAGCGNSVDVTPEPDWKLVSEFQAGGGGGAEGAAESATETATAGTGWGSLKGRFVLAGDPPPAKNLSTGGKDGAVCDVMPIPDESLVVDPTTKGIRHVVIYARKVSRVHESYAATADTEVVFDQKNCVFLTHVLPVRTSQPMRIKNSDPIGHNTNLSPPLEAGFNQSIAGGDSAIYQFKRAQNEPVPVACNIHPWMKAYIIPRVDPYLAVSDASGAFELANLPAGEELEFQVWHERASGGLVAKGDWAKGRFKLKLDPDRVVDLGEIAVGADLLK